MFQASLFFIQFISGSSKDGLFFFYRLGLESGQGVNFTTLIYNCVMVGEVKVLTFAE
jgi:hypothetical protein